MLERAIPIGILIKERLRSTTRQILLFIVAFTVIFYAAWRPQEGWTFFDYLLPCVLFAIPAGILFFLAWRVIRFALPR